jgi:hypothetical protein
MKSVPTPAAPQEATVEVTITETPPVAPPAHAAPVAPAAPAAPATPTVTIS